MLTGPIDTKYHKLLKTMHVSLNLSKTKCQSILAMTTTKSLVSISHSHISLYNPSLCTNIPLSSKFHYPHNQRIECPKPFPLFNDHPTHLFLFHVSNRLGPRLAGPFGRANFCRTMSL